jgi:hypothetical protein
MKRAPSGSLLWGWRFGVDLIVRRPEVDGLAQWMGQPCLTLRENMERPVTATEGTNREWSKPARGAGFFLAYPLGCDTMPQAGARVR